MTNARMTLYQFNQLDEMEQAEAVWSGVRLAKRIEGEFTVSLYQIDSFYVEVYYHRENNMIRKLRSFSSINQLEPYLQQINIDNI